MFSILVRSLLPRHWRVSARRPLPSAVVRRDLPAAALRTAARALFASLAMLGVAPAADVGANRVGEVIYRRGITSAGTPLEATHATGVKMKGADAACLNCHKRSGLGAKEGRSSIPPIAGRYLFHPRAHTQQDLDLPFVEGMRADREPYTDETLARAIRDGLNSDGSPLSDLMPHFALSDGDMSSLIDYLKRLDRRAVPGVTDSVLHFATIVTPDADPTKRRAVLDVIQQYFADKNAQPLGASPRLLSDRRVMFMVNRLWELHVWELSGPAATWETQLKERFAREPVLAVISGIGGRNWAPVHAFCESSAVPCLFPNVEVPVGNDHDFYSVYFSQGVLLEAQLLAGRIAGMKRGGRAPTVRQIYRAGDSGESAAQALTAALKKHGIVPSERALTAKDTPTTVAEAIRQAQVADALVLWLRPSDIAAMERLAAPPESTSVYMSGLLAEPEHSLLPARWRPSVRLTYLFDLPEKRWTRTNAAFRWFSIRKIPLVADRIQADTYLACGLLAETLSHMVDTFVPDYLLERVEEQLEHRIITGYYPRLSLAANQRFASKGGFLVRFADAKSTRLVADSDWIVP